MPSSSFFSGLDQVSEHPRKVHRNNNHGYPSSLQDSPYLSSPIRPIPSFSRHRGSSSISVTSKRSRTINSRTNSPAQSTVGSLRLTSPYSESIFSLHSLCTTSNTTRRESERQSLSRSVLLPHEIDVMVKQMKVDPKGNSHSKALDSEENGDDGDYDLSDFDDDSTITSDIAKSVCDEDVYNLILKEGDNEFLCQRRETLHKDCDLSSNEKQTKSDPLVGNDPQAIKLPSVQLDQTKNTDTTDKKGKMKQNERYSESNLKRSPYAVNQNKTKRSIGRKKKKIQDNVYI